MNKVATLLLAAAITAIIANPALAATATGAAAPLEPKPSATSGPSPAPEATATPAPAAMSPTPVTAKPAPAAAPSAPVVTAVDQVKIGYIDLSKIGRESKRGKSAAAAIKVRSEKLRARLAAKEKQLEKQKNKLESMPPDERATKIKEFQKKVEDFQKQVRSSAEEVQKLEEKLRFEVLDAVKKATESYGKKNGFTVIVEQNGVLFAADTVKPVDVTDEISRMIDQTRAK
jgi:outer membrane protein